MYKRILRDHQAVQEVISKLTPFQPEKHEKVFELEIREHKKNRSKAQNRLMHLWFTKMSREVFLTHGKQIDPEGWKEYFKLFFLGKEVIEMPNGQLSERVRRTRDLNTTQMSAFLNDVDHMAGSEYQIQLPHPEDLWREAMGIK